MKDEHNAVTLTGPHLWELGYRDGINRKPMRGVLGDSPEYRSGWHTGRNE